MPYGRTGLECWKWRHKVKPLVSNSIHAKKDRMALSANQVISTDAVMLFAPFRCTHTPPPVQRTLPEVT